MKTGPIQSTLRSLPFGNVNSENSFQELVFLTYVSDYGLS